MSPRGEFEPPGAPTGLSEAGRGDRPPSEEELAREREVRRRLSEAADGAGFLRFDRFVEISLYSPEVGFYTRPGVVLGPHGEYYTAAHVTPLFGRAVARRIAREHAEAGRPDRWNVVELGAGDGTLASDVISGLGREMGSEAQTTYTIVERSVSLRRAAVERASSAARGSSVQVEWAETLGSLGPVRGFVLANELLDAMPFRRLVRRNGEWHELGVHVRSDGVGWLEGPIVGDRSLADLPAAEEGTQLEVCPGAEALPREIADHLTRGTALFIDYGSEERGLVLGHPGGTLAAVGQHRPVRDPLGHPGLVDLSAFVNFTRVRRASRAAGLEEAAYRPMREALLDWGIEGLLEAERVATEGSERDVRARMAVKNLLVGFDTFQVLEVRPR